MDFDLLGILYMYIFARCAGVWRDGILAGNFQVHCHHCVVSCFNVCPPSMINTTELTSNSLIDTGAIGGKYIGFTYWKHPGPFANGINGFGKVLVLAAVMYFGTEAVAITAGESRNPKKDLPKALKQTFWRILIVYVGMVFFTGLIVPSNLTDLLSAASKWASSPVTIAPNKAGWAGAGNLINSIIVVTLLSSINSAIYKLAAESAPKRNQNELLLSLPRGRPVVLLSTLSFSRICSA
jgi:amino acid transporter